MAALLIHDVCLSGRAPLVYHPFSDLLVALYLCISCCGCIHKTIFSLSKLDDDPGGLFNIHHHGESDPRLLLQCGSVMAQRVLSR